MTALVVPPAEFAQLDLVARLQVLRQSIPGRIVFTTSFGLEDQAITHAIAEGGLDIQIVTLDTGRLFPETHAIWAETLDRYGIPIRAIFPRTEAVEALVARDGINGFYESIEARKACCHVRKVEPLDRALKGADAWVTALRAEQSMHRGSLSFVEKDPARGVAKINPLLDWTRERLVSWTTARGVPDNALHAQGFPSIGCAPCTRAVTPGEEERAGRWWWEQQSHKEYGLHITADGQVRRPAMTGASA